MNALLSLVAPRYKAVAALLIPLIGGLLFLISTGEFNLKHLAGIVAVALGAGGATHIVPNVAKVGVETVGAVADTAVTEVAGTVNHVVTPVAETATGVVGKLTGILGGILGKKPKP